jgi:hypothetical protein
MHVQLMQDLEDAFQDFDHNQWLGIGYDHIPWDIFPKMMVLKPSKQTIKQLIIRAEAIVEFFYNHWTRSAWDVINAGDFPLDGLLSRLRLCILLNTLGLGDGDLVEKLANREIKDDNMPFTRGQLNFISDDEKRTGFLDLQKFFLLNADAEDLHVTVVREGAYAAYNEVRLAFDSAYYLWSIDQIPPFAEEEVLGWGTLGAVTKVSHVFNGKQYARRCFPMNSAPVGVRHRFFELPRLQEQLDFCQILYPGNRHIVQVIGSYLQGSRVAILLEPIADCNLLEYLQKFHTFPDQEKEKSNLYRLFGCLCVTLKSMYNEEMPKKTIKPGSILIHGSNVLFTGFHIDAPSVGYQTRTRKEYTAPEWWENVFSLGCVFLEVVTVLAGKRLRKSVPWNYSRDIPGLQNWLRQLAKYSDDKRLVLPLRLCSQMLADKESRPGIESLIVEIVKTLPQDVSLKEYFCVDCLTLLVLDGTIPGKFLTPLIHSK